MSLKIKSLTLFLNFLTIFSKIEENLGKNSGNCEKKLGNSLNFSEKLSINPCKERNLKNLFNSMFYAGRALRCYHYQLSTMNISIGESCLNKKKPIWVYSSSPLKRSYSNHILVISLVLSWDQSFLNSVIV